MFSCSEPTAENDYWQKVLIELPILYFNSLCSMTKYVFDTFKMKILANFLPQQPTDTGRMPNRVVYG